VEDDLLMMMTMTMRVANGRDEKALKVESQESAESVVIL
jgi:hypothetical protein